jgi:hypothetical protein
MHAEKFQQQWQQANVFLLFDDNAEKQTKK